MCIILEKNGVSATCASRMKRMPSERTSPSMVSMGFSGVLDPPVGPAVDDPAWPETLLELAEPFIVQRIVAERRLRLGIEVVEVPEELAESTAGGQELVVVAEMVLVERAF